MSMPLPPPDTRAAGQTGHIADHNTISDALGWLAESVGTLQSASSAVTPAWCNVKGYGAAGDGNADDTTAIGNAIAACIRGGGGIVYLPAGTYKTTATLTMQVPDDVTVVLAGDGYQATVIAFAGTGDAVRLYNPAAYTQSMNISWGSGLRGLTIDGASAGDGSSGLHAGDIGNMKLDVWVQNFSGAGSIGVNLDNTVTWTEECDVRAVLLNCSSHVVMQVTTGYNSFGYGNFDFTIFQGSNQQDGLVVQAGAFLYHGTLRLRGNFVAGSGTTTAAAIVVTGTGPGGSQAAGFVSQLMAMRLDVQLECSAGAHPPQTISVSTADFNAITGCWGSLDFSLGAGSFAPATAQTGLVRVAGIIAGDASLAPAGAGQQDASFMWRAAAQPVLYAPQPDVAGAFELFFPTAYADMFRAVLGGNWAVSLNFSGVNNGATLGVPQKVTIFLSQPLTGGTYNYTVSWPHNSSPTTSSPTVRWPGGTAPVMSTGPGASDTITLVTYDGATWDGHAGQAMA